MKGWFKMKLIEKFRDKKLQYRIKKHKHNVRKQYNGNDITIISNNCLAGVIYNILGLQFSSPTINLWMKMAEYLEFVSDLKYYMQCEMIENTQESDNYKFPVGTLVPFDNTHKSVNIYFNHYQSYEIAKQKWEERKQRIIWDKLYVIYDFNDKDCDTDLLYEFDKLPFKHKMSLTHYKKVDGLKDYI